MTSLRWCRNSPVIWLLPHIISCPFPVHTWSSPGVSKYLLFPHTVGWPSPRTPTTKFPLSVLPPKSLTTVGGVHHPSVPSGIATRSTKSSPSCSAEAGTPSDPLAIKWPYSLNVQPPAQGWHVVCILLNPLDEESPEMEDLSSFL